MSTPHYLSSLARRSSDPAISWLMKLTLDQPHLISLAAGFTDNETLPVEGVGALVDELLRDDTAARAALQYGSTGGDAGLRQLTLDRVCAQDGIAPGAALTADDVVITTGSQQGLNLLAKAFIDPGEPVLVENPCFIGALSAFRASEAELRGIPVDRDGISMEALRQEIER